MNKSKKGADEPNQKISSQQNKEMNVYEKLNSLAKKDKSKLKSETA